MTDKTQESSLSQEENEHEETPLEVGDDHHEAPEGDVEDVVEEPTGGVEVHDADDDESHGATVEVLGPEDEDGVAVLDDEGSVVEVIDVGEEPEVDEQAERLAQMQQALEESQAKQEDLTKERDEFKSRMLHIAADLENVRKRKEREKAELRKYGATSVVLDILPAVDNMERALDHAGTQEEGNSLSDGVRMVHKQLLTSLQKHGIKSFVSLHEAFDPQRHEAIQQMESSEFPSNTVVQEFQKGYFIHERLLRPALVVVSKYVEPVKPEEQLEEISSAPGVDAPLDEDETHALGDSSDDAE